MQSGPADVVGGGAKFSAMAVSLSRSLISDDGLLLVDYARRYGIRTIFLPVGGQDIPNLLTRNPTTVKNLKALFATCTVYMLAGDETWLDNPTTMPADARSLAQQIGPMYPQFAGILYDIEPQTYPSWDRNRQGTIDRYFALLDTLLLSRNPSTFRSTIVSTIPAFARQPNRFGRQNPSMLQEIERYRAIDGTYFMMAGNTSSAQLERAAPAFPQMHKPYWAVSNTSPYSGVDGYSGQPPYLFYTNMVLLRAGAHRANPNIQALAVSAWDDLFTSLQTIVPQPTPQPIPDPTGPLVPHRGTDYIGAYVSPNGETAAPSVTAKFEEQIGRKLAYDIHYDSWDGVFPGAGEADDVANDRIPLNSWKCGDSNARVAAGHDDALIRARAKAIRAFGHPMFIRYEWEMNENALGEARKACYDPNTDLPTGFFSPTEYVAAWKHIRAIFAAERANNVVWVWNPGVGPDIAQYYPGDDQVDWVGFDSYDRKNLTFQQTFFPFLDVVSQFKKPMLVVETGAPADEQAGYLDGVLNALKYRYPLVRGFSYFDSFATDNWSLTPPGIAAFRALANSPFMSARQPH